MKHIGTIYISTKLLLQWLQLYPMGEVRDVRYEVASDAILITIEHPEMPEVADNVMPPVVSLMFTMWQDDEGHRVHIREKIRDDA